MEPLLKIGSNEYRKTDGVFKVPLAFLQDLHFIDVPYYSTVEIVDLPQNSLFELAASAIHGGGPDNEDFSFFFHVTFQVAGPANSSVVTAACERRFAHVERAFGHLVSPGTLDDSDGDRHRVRINGAWYCDKLYSQSFERAANPVLGELVRPLLDAFAQLIARPDVVVFLCHASEDKQFVDELASYVAGSGLGVWYDKREIRAGDSIVERVSEGLDTASHLVVVLSQASVTKPWVTRELSSALMAQLGDRSIKVIPVLREDCAIPPLLCDIRYIDCRADCRSGFERLVDDIISGTT